MRRDGEATPDDAEAGILAIEIPDDPVFVRINLPTAMTGVEGIIAISTTIEKCQPHVRWSAKAGRNEPGISVLIHGNGVRVATGVEGSVQCWVDVNRDALIQLWRDGDTWAWDEVSAFCDALQQNAGPPIPGRSYLR